MIKSERIVKKINEKIKSWLKDHAKLVVAIDGYAGSGKTTVADFIAKENPDALVVHLDDFIHHWKDRKRMIDQVKDKSKVFEYSWYRYDDLEKLIKAFKTKKKGKHKISKEWDKTIYLDVDFAKADKKRIAREKKKWGKNYVPENHPDNWTRYFKEAYWRYVKKYKPQKNRDFIFKVSSNRQPLSV